MNHCFISYFSEFGQSFGVRVFFNCFADDPELFKSFIFIHEFQQFLKRQIAVNRFFRKQNFIKKIFFFFF